MLTCMHVYMLVHMHTHVHTHVHSETAPPDSVERSKVSRTSDTLFVHVLLTGESWSGAPGNERSGRKSDRLLQL